VVIGKRAKFGADQPAVSTHRAGFTLVEVMITLVIVAVIAGMATLSFGKNPARELEREAARLQLLLQTLSDEAVMQGAEFALALPTEGYQFLSLDSETSQWQALAEEAYLFYALAADITITVEVEGESVEAQKLLQQQAGASGQEALRPVLLLLSSGETTPFRIALSRPGAGEYTISSDGVSGIYIQ